MVEETDYMRVQLHEDTDANKEATDALHSFLEPINKDPLNEWEGFNEGVCIYLRVQVGDYIDMTPDGWIRVVRAENLLNRTLHPFILTARQMLEEDSGGHLLGTVYPGRKIDFDTLYVPSSRWTPEQLWNVEAAFKWIANEHGMTGIDSGLYNFVAGEQGEIERFVEKHKETCPDLPLACKFIDDYFNGWCDE